MIAKVSSIIPYGLSAKLIDVEGDSSRGLPIFNIIGLASRALTEAKDRVRSAIKNSNLLFPPNHLTVNLAPAELAKSGTHLDLAIALAVIVASNQLLERDIENKLFIGELSLDGHIKPVPSIFNLVEEAKLAGFKEIYIPVDNLSEVTSAPGITIYGADTLIKLILHLKGQRQLVTSDQVIFTTKPKAKSAISFNDVLGHEFEKRALSIAIAGHHNVLMIGPPGCGKSLLARSTHSLLPPLTESERYELNKIYSAAGQHFDGTRPFRTPHCSATLAAMSGNNLKPGEFTLAHHGVLYLDEFPYFSKNILSSLRQPLEDRQILVSRALEKQLYPANFTLIATMNPCPCGYAGTRECHCSKTEIKIYLRNLTKPLLGRFDIILNLKEESNSALLTQNSASQNDVKNTITGVISKQFTDLGAPSGTANITTILQNTTLDEAAKHLLETTHFPSNRELFKVLRLARTIADFDHQNTVTPTIVQEALKMHQEPLFYPCISE